MKFRLPTITEFRYLFTEFIIVKKLLKDCDCKYWSSSPSADPNYYAWSVNFFKGYDNGMYEDGNLSVRLVREGQSLASWHYGSDPKNRFMLSKCSEFMTDRLTSLEWKVKKETGTYNWGEAMKRFR